MRFLKMDASINLKGLPIITVSDEKNYRIKICISTDKKSYTDTITDLFLLEKINLFLKSNLDKSMTVTFQKSNCSNDYGISLTSRNHCNITDIQNILDKDLKVFCYNGKHFLDNRIMYKYDDVIWYSSIDSFIQVNVAAGHYIHSLVKSFTDKYIDCNCIYGLGGECGIYTRCSNKYLCLTNSKEIYEDCMYNGQKDTVLVNYDTVLLKDYFVNKKSILVINISRNGLRGLAKQVVEIDFLGIIYIGCLDKSVERDIGILKERYNIVSIQKINQFPNTGHYSYVIEFVKIDN